jgi:hypothetical protein
LIKKMAATVVSLSTLIIPIVALALGRAFLGETVTPLAVAGIVTILAGVAIAIAPVAPTLSGSRGEPGNARPTLPTTSHQLPTSESSP